MPNTFVLYSKMTHVTGKAITEALGATGGRTLPNPKDYDILIRWGNADSPTADDDYTRTINKSPSIMRIVNRQHMFTTIGRIANSQYCLGTGFNVGPLGPSSWCTVLRHRYGKWGRDIMLVPNSYDITNWDNLAAQAREGGPLDGYFPVEWFPADYEVRVHIVNGSSVLMQYKGHVDDEHVIDHTKMVVRNRKHGWHLYGLSDRIATNLRIDKSALRSTAKQIIDGLGLDFGVVDFLVRTPSGAFTRHLPDIGNGPIMMHKVLEVNTGPGLEESSVERYRAALQNIIDIAPAPHSPPPQTQMNLEEAVEAVYTDPPAPRPFRLGSSATRETIARHDETEGPPPNGPEFPSPDTLQRALRQFGGYGNIGREPDLNEAREVQEEMARAREEPEEEPHYLSQAYADDAPSDNAPFVTDRIRPRPLLGWDSFVSGRGPREEP